MERREKVVTPTYEIDSSRTGAETRTFRVVLANKLQDLPLAQQASLWPILFLLLQRPALLSKSGAAAAAAAEGARPPARLLPSSAVLILLRRRRRPTVAALIWAAILMRRQRRSLLSPNFKAAERANSKQRGINSALRPLLLHFCGQKQQRAQQIQIR